MASDDHPVTSKIITKGVPPILSYESHARSFEVYQKFLQWQKSKETNSFGEEVLLAYFRESAKALSPSYLWSIYSMLETSIKANHNINIRYDPLIAFLKLNDCRNEISNVFTGDEMMKFLLEAPDYDYLAIKV